MGNVCNYSSTPSTSGGGGGFFKSTRSCESLTKTAEDTKKTEKDQEDEKTKEEKERTEMSKEDLELFVSPIIENVKIKPDAPTKDSIVNSVISKFAERSNLGYIKYGKTLDRKDLTTGQWIQHMQEELMDAILYLERLRKDMDEITGGLDTKKDENKDIADNLSHYILFGEHRFSDASKDEERPSVAFENAYEEILNVSNHSLPEPIESCMINDHLGYASDPESDDLLPDLEIAPAKPYPDIPTYKGPATWEQHI
jgi:hypothetical protein